MSSRACGEGEVSSSQSSRSLRSCTDFEYGCNRSRGPEATGVALRNVVSPLLIFFGGDAMDAALLASGVQKLVIKPRLLLEESVTVLAVIDIACGFLFDFEDLSLPLALSTRTQLVRGHHRSQSFLVF